MNSVILGDLPNLISVRELREYLKCSPNVVYSLVKKREFPSFKIGGVYYINKDEIPAWIEKNIKRKK